MRKKLEIAVFNLEAANIAQQNGASRLELCEHYAEGGLTPKMDTVALALDQYHLPINVIIRPRSGDFHYSDAEIARMISDITNMKALGVHGFVFGVLNAAGNIDLEKNRKLLEAAHPLPCTFHRAFDHTNNWQKALDEIVNLGFHTILTAGGAQNSVVDAAALQEITQYANGRVQVMPGGGLRPNNLEEVVQKTNAEFYHSAAIVSEDTADPSTIQDMIEILDQY